VLSLLWRGVPQASVTPLRIFATGMLVFIAADVTYDYTTIHAPYHGGDPVDTLWMLALIILWVAAVCQLRVGKTLGYVAPPRPTAARPSALPYLAVAGSYLLLTVVGLRHVDFDSLGGVLLGAVLLTCWPTWPRPAASTFGPRTSRAGMAATSSSSWCRGSPACGRSRSRPG